MPVLYESTRYSDVLLYEVGREINFARDHVTLPSGSAPVVIGTVMGQQSVGGATSAVKASGGNTGNGTLVLDVTTPELSTAKPGIYTVRATVAGTNSATFRVTDPVGSILGDVSFSGSGASATFTDRIKFAITDGGTDFVVGDGFDITVAAGNGKFVPLSTTAVDGTQNAAGVCLTAVPVSPAADMLIVAVDRGPATFKYNGLVWPVGFTTNQINAAIAQLQALGMTVRMDY